MREQRRRQIEGIERKRRSFQIHANDSHYILGSEGGTVRGGRSSRGTSGRGCRGSRGCIGSLGTECEHHSQHQRQERGEAELAAAAVVGSTARHGDRCLNA